MKKIAFLLSLLTSISLLAACSAEPAAEPTAEATTVTPAVKPSLPAPDQALLAELFAKACPEAKPVKTAVCRRAGMGSSEVNCEFGLGEDEYLRNKATLVAGESAWTLKDPEAICAAAK